MLSVDPPDFTKNSVDFEGKDGLFYHGTAIGCLKEKVVVDFGLEGRKLSLIPFGWLYFSKLPNFISFDCFVQRNVERPVQALVRVYASLPWMWYPATLLPSDCGFNGFGKVRVYLPDRTLESVLPTDRIREVPSKETLQSLVIQKGTLKSKKASMISKKETNDKSGSETGDGLEFLSICMDVLVEIFGYVDTFQQANLRRVCAKWDAVLTLATVSQDMWVADYSAHEEWFPIIRAHYMSLACLYDCLTESTKTVIFTDSWPLDNDDIQMSRAGTVLYSLKDFVEVMELGTGKVCKTLVLANLLIDWPYLWGNIDAWDWLEELRGHLEQTMLRAPVSLGCQTLLMKNVDVTLNRWHVHIVMTIKEGRIDVAQCKSLGNLWDKLNASVPALDAGDVVRLAEWIHETGTTDNVDLWDIVQILDAVQSSDSRDGTYYKYVEWFPIGLERIADLDVSKLTRLTQHRLWTRYTDRTSRILRIYVSW